MKPQLSAELVQELIDYRLASYEARQAETARPSAEVTTLPSPADARTELAYFPNLQMACGSFRTGRADAEESRTLGPGHGRLDPARHFIARASGDSMDGGERPIRDGDYLLLEHLVGVGESSGRAGSGGVGSGRAGAGRSSAGPAAAGDFAALAGEVVAVEREAASGGRSSGASPQSSSRPSSSPERQYLLRVPVQGDDGHLALRAANPAYADLAPDASMRPVARLCAVLDPLEFAVGRTFQREQIAALFGVEFNPGNWHSGHVVLPSRRAHVLLVTLNKQGKAADHRYLDHWIDGRTFHWQTQNKTTPSSKRGREVIEHAARGIGLHLFVRERKLEGGKAAPFVYHGRVRYLRHEGSGPMSVVLGVGE